VVCSLGLTTISSRPESPPSAQQLRDEFGVLTNSGGLTRRRAISALSRKHRMSAGDIYKLLESTKISIG
jgi:hypothetical protein